MAKFLLRIFWLFLISLPLLKLHAQSNTCGFSEIGPGISIEDVQITMGELPGICETDEFTLIPPIAISEKIEGHRAINGDEQGDIVLLLELPDGLVFKRTGNSIGVTPTGGTITYLNKNVQANGIFLFLKGASPANGVYDGFSISGIEVKNIDAGAGDYEIKISTVVGCINGILADGNSVAATIKVLSNPEKPSVSFPNGSGFCAGDNIPDGFVNITAGHAVRFFSDEDLNTEILSIADRSHPTAIELGFNSAGAGSASVFVVAESAQGCLSDAVKIEIDVFEDPFLDLSSINGVICPGEVVEIDLRNYSSGTLSWVNDNTAVGLGASGGDFLYFTAAQNNTGSVIESTVEVTALLNGCEAKDYITFSLVPGPSIGAFSPAIEICNISGEIDLRTDPRFNIPVINGGDLNAAAYVFTGKGITNVNGTFDASSQSWADNELVDIDVTFTREDGCSATRKLTLIKVISNPSVTISSPLAGSEHCRLSPVTLTLETNNQTSGISWQSSGNGSFSGSFNSALSVNTFTYTPGEGDLGPVTLKVTSNQPDAPCSVDSDEIIINFFEPKVEQVADLSLCPGETISSIGFSSTTLPGEGTFNWEVADWELLGLSSGTGTGDLTGIEAADNFTLLPKSTTVKVTQTVAGCTSKPMTFHVLVKLQPVAAAKSAITACPGELVEVNFASSPTDPATIFEWTSTNDDIGLAASGQGSISFTAVNSSDNIIFSTISYTSKLDNCISEPQSFNIYVNPTPQLNPHAAIEVCSGDQVQSAFASTVAGSTFSWTIEDPVLGMATSGSGDLDFTSESHYGISPVSRTVKVWASKDDCTGSEQSFDIILKPLPKVEVLDDFTIKPGDNVAEINFNDNSGGTGTFSWTATNALEIGLPSSSGTGSIPAFTASGNTTGESITSVITVSSQWGVCNSSEAMVFKIDLKARPVMAPLANLLVCPGEELVVEFEADIPGSTFSWQHTNAGIGLLSTSGSGDLAFTAGENHGSSAEVSTFKVVPISPDEVAGDTLVFTISVRPSPLVVQLAELAICPDESISSIIFTSENLDGEGVFNWEVVDWELLGLSAAAGTGSISGITGSNNTSGTDKSTLVKVTQTVGGCTGPEMTFTVVVKPEPVVHSQDDVTVCPGDFVEIDFAAIPADPSTLYEWTSTNTATGLAASGTGSIGFTAANNTTGQIFTTILYTAKINGCTSVQKSFVISVNPSPLVLAQADIEVCSGDVVQSELQSNLSGTSFSWTIEDPVLGMEASGTGNLDFTSQPHYGTGPVSRVVKVRAIKDDCQGPEQTFNIVLHPLPKVVPKTNFVVFPSESVDAISFTDNSGGESTITWTATNAFLLGLPSGSGTGPLPAFIAESNNSGESIISKISVYASWNGCNSDGAMEFEIELSPQPEIVDVSDVVACPLSPVEVVFTSDVEGTTFNWTNDNTAIGLAPSGTGNISFTTANNITTTNRVAYVEVTPVSPDGVEGESATFTITLRPAPVVSGKTDILLCPGEDISSIGFTSSNMPGLGVYNWEVGNKDLLGLTNSSGSGSIGGIVAGINNTGEVVSTEVSVTQTVNGCTSQPMTFHINVKPKPVLITINNLAFCPGDEITIPFAANTDPGETVFSWTSSNTLTGTPASGTGALTFTAAENTHPEAFTSEIKYKAVANGCESDEKSFIVNILQEPVLDQPEDVIVCSGELVRNEFSSSMSGATFSWTIEDPVLGMPATGTGNLNFSTDEHYGSTPVVRTISVVAIRNGCVSGQKEFNVILKPKPKLVEHTEVVIFPGDEVDEIFFSDNSAGASAISWTASNANLIGLPANSGTASILAFTAEDNTSGGTIESSVIVDAVWDGCHATSMQFLIKLRPRPILDPISDIISCPGDPVSVVFESNVPGTTFNWTNDNVNTGLAASGSGSFSFDAPVNFSGSPYISTIKVTPVSPSGFAGRDVEFKITVNPMPVINDVDDIEICPGATASVNFVANTTGERFYWTNDDERIGLEQSGEGDFIFTGAENFSGGPRVATITYFADRDGCQSASKTFTITLKNEPVTDQLAAMDICPGDEFTPAAFTDDTGGASTFYWTVDRPDLLGLEENSGTGSIPGLLAAANNTGAPIVITFEYFSALNGCISGKLDFVLTLLPSPVLISGDVIACAGEDIRIDLGANTGGGEAFFWENSNPAIGLANLSGSGNVIEFVATNPTEGDLSATITVGISKDGCTYPGQTFEIVVKPLPKVINLPEEMEQYLCSGEAIVFNPISNQENVSFEWTASSLSELQHFETSGEGAINEIPLNTTNQLAIIKYKIYPVREDDRECRGEASELLVNLSPVPDLKLQQTTYTICNGSDLSIIPASNTQIEGTYYEWEVEPNGLGITSGSGSEIFTSYYNDGNVADTIIFSVNAVAGNCRSASQEVTVYVRPFAVVDAGADFTVCEEDPIVLQATIGGSATFGTWSGGLGSFQNPISSTTTYRPEPSETGTSIQFVFTTNDPPGPCASISDTIIVTIEPLPELAIINLPRVYCTQNDPFPLVGNPANGTFSGDGVIFDSEENRYYFDPAISGIGLYRVTYAYQSSNGCTGTSSGLIDVSSGSNPDFNILSTNENVCETQARIGLTPLVNGGIFEGPGVEITGGKAWFNPGQGDLGENTITYTITDQHTGCTTSSSQSIWVHARPDITIEYENLCIDNGVKFRSIINSISEGDEVLTYQWSFGDGFSSSEEAPVREFNNPGIYDVSLRVQTAFSCEFVEIYESVVVSNIRALDFSFENICGNDTTIFTSMAMSSILNFSHPSYLDLEYLWNFGDPASGENNLSTEANTKHKFSGFGEYEIQLTVRSNMGCERSVAQKINIVPAISNFPHSQQFEGNASSTGWFSEGTNSSWQYGVPAGEVISEAAVAGTNIWATGLLNGSGYNNNERSYIISPCFDLQDIDQPMISMNLFMHTEPGRDGAVLQYSKDGGRTWLTLGNQGQGLNWYNSTNIVADPAGRGIGNEGWSGPTSEWREVAYSLDELRKEAKSVIFRIAFASDANNVGENVFEGLGVDDVYIGSRNKKVLVENFTNTNALGFTDNILSFNTLGKDEALGEDVILLQYHTPFPQKDSVNQRNSRDPGARSLFYGISQAPTFVIDGVKSGVLNQSVIRRQSLSKPNALIDIDLQEQANSSILKGSVEIQPIGQLKEELILYINAVEVEAGSGLLTYSNVLRKIIPESSGIYLNSLEAARSFDFEWSLPKDFDAGNLGIVVYIQEKTSKRIIQSSFKAVSIPMKSGVITSIEDISFELKKLKLYPNPVNDRIRLHTNSQFGVDLRYEIIQMGGIILQKGILEAGKKSYEISCGNLIDGAYILRVYSEKGEPVTFKVMVMKHDPR